MTTHENQITDYPKGARVEAIRNVPCGSTGVIPAGTRGTVSDHTHDGRAWIYFDNFNAGHTFSEAEHFIRVVCTHRDDNCPANHEQPRPEQAGGEVRHTDNDECAFVHALPSGSVRCGALRQHHSQYTGHKFTEPDAPAAPERGNVIDGDLFIQPLPNTTKFLLLTGADWPVAEVYTKAEAEQLRDEPQPAVHPRRTAGAINGNR